MFTANIRKDSPPDNSQSEKSHTDDHLNDWENTLSTLNKQRYRRRPALIGLGVALLAICGSGAAYLAHIASDTEQVIAIAHDVYRGETLGKENITLAEAAADPAVTTVPAHNLENMIGKIATADLAAGSLLTPNAVTSDPLPDKGNSIVGVALTHAQMPQLALTPGDKVRIFDTPNSGDAPPEGSPHAIQAEIVSISDATDTGHTVVNVLVDEETAGKLIARVATGRIGLALDSSVGKGGAS